MAKTRRNYSGGAIATTTSGSIAATGTTTFTIASFTGWPSGSAPFFVVVEPGTANEEKLLVTRAGASDTTLTVYGTPNVAANRGLDGTVASAHSPGSAIYPVFTAQDADEANEMAATLTTKGDLLLHGASTFTRVGVGSNNTVLVADSAQSAGVKWGQVQTAGIGDDQVTQAKIAAGAIGETELANGAVTAAKLASNAAMPAGSVTAFAGSSAPTGWLLCDGTAVSRSTYAVLFAAIGTAFGGGDGNTTFNVPNMNGRVIAGRDVSQTEFDFIGETGGRKDSVIVDHVHAAPQHTHTVSHAHEMPHTHNVAHTHSHGHEHLTSNRLVNVAAGSAGTALEPFDNAGSGSRPGLSGTRDTDPVSTGAATITNSGGVSTSKTSGTDTQNSGQNVAANTGGASSAVSDSVRASGNLQPYLVMNYIIKT